MCGRYSLALRPSQVRRYLENEHLPVFDAPDDDAEGAPRQSYNFAPGYHGIVYRADTPDWGAGHREHKQGDGSAEADGTAAVEEDQEEQTSEVRYKLQSMKWGLIPFWTKRNPDYGSMMKTINCRDDSLIDNRGMWTSMKNKKRCVVVAQGFYEWLKKGKEKVPHYTKRKDGSLMYFAGLWDCVQYEGSEDKHYTYTVITTSSNKQLKFLHDRMPVILEKDDIKTWLDPHTSTWTKELQSLLKASDTELECYAVSKEVGKVGNNSPTFIIPVASSENKSNIANFFAKGNEKESSKSTAKSKPESKDDLKQGAESAIKTETEEKLETMDHEGTEDNAPLPIPKEEKKAVKRDLDDVPDDEPPSKVRKTSTSPMKPTPSKVVKKGKSSTSNNTASTPKTADKAKGSQKITNFFGK